MGAPSARGMVVEARDQSQSIESGRREQGSALRSRRREQKLERAQRAFARSAIGEQAMCEVEAETDAVELERELTDVEVRPQLAFFDRLLRDAGDAVEPGFLLLDEVVAE